MKFLFRLLLLCLISSVSYAQNVYQIRADSVRIYSGCDTAELIIENHTQDTLGFLFNKGKGRTEFRKLRMKMLADNSLVIPGQDTVLLGNGFVKLQTAVVQPGGFSIGGSGFSTGQFQVKRNGADTVSGGLALFNAIQTRGVIMQLNGDVNPGMSTWIHNGSAWVKRMEINSGTGVVDMPYGFIGGNGSKIRGTGIVDTSQAFLQFVESDGTTRTGLVGMASKTSKDAYLISEKGKVNLYPNNSALTGYMSIEPTNLLYSGGTVILNNATSNMLYFTGAGLGAPTVGTRTTGTKIILAAGSAGTTDFGIGMEGSNVWNSVSQNLPNVGWKFYGGTSQIGRIDGKGGADWEGMSRFKGDYSSGAGPATEVGFSSGQAQLRGYNRTTNMYTTISVTGGSTANDPKSFAIDGTGYRFNMLTNAGMLGTDANGYLISKVASLSNILAAGNQTGNNPIVFNRTLSAANQLMDWQQGFGVYSDNLTSVDGVNGARIWFDSPDNGDIVLGPRNGSNFLGTLRIKARNIKLEGGTPKFFNVGILGTDASGYLINSSANFVQALGAVPQAISFNISGSGVAKSIATGANIGNEDFVIYKSSHPDSLATNKRWVFYKSGAETGGNAGSNFVISRYNDNGVFQDNPFQIARVNGDVIFSTGPKVTVGQNRESLWYQSNHPAGGAVTVGFPGATVLDSFFTNSAGHVTQVKTRALKAADIAAAPATGSTSYIQNQSASAQAGSFNLNGTGALGGNLTIGGNVVVTGTVTATGFNPPSLRALKMNIKDFELNALRIIDSIKVREFEYKKAPGRKVIGIIADDEPSIISGEKHDHLDMMNAIGLLLKSIQELNAKVDRSIEETNARLDKLEKKINNEHSSK
ncbi:MAG: tail fiber domain-containing protein [Chitinophaga sp.]|uniref:tail fiber domain-containing protein n=1 Tax=Chitinophaga sp. TaxID=1869181 RepID=UPI001B297236|nr:tail fiber domain-containing protein [Chitinophaga sp.]MBO9729199.1 tail fiber domain-containing protein [Chitinophaga sp.]